MATGTDFRMAQRESMRPKERIFDRMSAAPTSAQTLEPGPNPSNRRNRLEGSMESTETCTTGWRHTPRQVRRSGQFPPIERVA